MHAAKKAGQTSASSSTTASRTFDDNEGMSAMTPPGSTSSDTSGFLSQSQSLSSNLSAPPMPKPHALTDRMSNSSTAPGPLVPVPVNARVSGQIDPAASGHMDGHVSGHMDGLVSGHMDGRVSGHMDGLVSGQMDGLVSGHADGLASIQVTQERIKIVQLSKSPNILSSNGVKEKKREHAIDPLLIPSMAANSIGLTPHKTQHTGQLNGQQASPLKPSKTAECINKQTAQSSLLHSISLIPPPATNPFLARSDADPATSLIIQVAPPRVDACAEVKPVQMQCISQDEQVDRTRREFLALKAEVSDLREQLAGERSARIEMEVQS